jgi:peptide/nickel transport system permease protein
MLSAVYRDTWVDHWTRVVSVSGVALPAFWLGLMLQLLLALYLGWLPLGGRLGLTATPPAPITHLLFVGRAAARRVAHARRCARARRPARRHAVLPGAGLDPAREPRRDAGHAGAGLHQDGARPGLLGVRVVDALRPAQRHDPTLTMIGLRYGWMLGGTILVETVFDWPASASTR